jgi:hypothetical protein
LRVNDRKLRRKGAEEAEYLALFKLQVRGVDGCDRKFGGITFDQNFNFDYQAVHPAKGGREANAPSDERIGAGISESKSPNSRESWLDNSMLKGTKRLRG